MPGLIWTCFYWTCHHHFLLFIVITTGIYNTTAWDDAPIYLRERWAMTAHMWNPHVFCEKIQTCETWGIPYHSKPCFACGRWWLVLRPSFFVPRIWGGWMLRLDTDWIPRGRDSGERGIWICFQDVCVRRRQWTSWIIHVFDRFCTYVCIIYDYVNCIYIYVYISVLIYMVAVAFWAPKLTFLESSSSRLGFQKSQQSRYKNHFWGWCIIGFTPSRFREFEVCFFPQTSTQLRFICFFWGIHGVLTGCWWF